MQREVRQGDSLSLSPLFLIVVEGLKCLLDKAVELGLIDGIFISDAIPNLSLLPFTDDTLIFMPADLEKLKNLQWVLIYFKLISGLKINFYKSSLVGLNVHKPFLVEASAILRCKIGSLPLKYLSLPLSRKRVSTPDWNSIINRIKQ